MLFRALHLAAALAAKRPSENNEVGLNNEPKWRHSPSKYQLLMPHLIALGLFFYELLYSFIFLTFLITFYIFFLNFAQLNYYDTVDTKYTSKYPCT